MSLERNKKFSATASLSSVLCSPMRTRWIADLVRGRNVGDASRQLLLAEKKPAAVIRKLLLSALSNAEAKGVADLDRLFVNVLTVDEGPRIRRFMPRAQGRADRQLTRTSHIFLALSERAAPGKKKSKTVDVSNSDQPKKAKKVTKTKSAKTLKAGE
jgi:large subunit ribosomal protein L22